MGLACRLIALGAMSPPPTWLLIESLLMALNAVPAQVVRPVVRAQRLDDMRCFAITTLTAMVSKVFDAHLIYP
jgi:hypothetical protein